MNRDNDERFLLALAVFVTVLQVGLQVWMWFWGPGPSWGEFFAFFSGTGAPR